MIFTECKIMALMYVGNVTDIWFRTTYVVTNNVWSRLDVFHEQHNYEGAKAKMLIL